MLRRAVALCLLAAFSVSAWSEVQVRKLTCYLFTVEGRSSEGNALYQKYMAIGPAVAQASSPTRFSFGKKGFSAEVEGKFSYSTGEFALIERYGSVAFGSVSVEVRGAKLPKVRSRESVEIEVEALAAQGGTVQPGTAAIEKAARKLGLKKGLAWVEGMELVGKDRLRVLVAFAK